MPVGVLVNSGYDMPFIPSLRYSIWAQSRLAFAPALVGSAVGVRDSGSIGGAGGPIAGGTRVPGVPA